MGVVNILLTLSALHYAAQAFCLGSQQSPLSHLRHGPTNCHSNRGIRVGKSCLATVNGHSEDDDKEFKHILALLTMPYSSTDRIANEAILSTAIGHTTSKLSVVLRCEGGDSPSLASLRRYVGEVYSMLWDFAMASGNPDFLDVVVYPQNLPNSAPEQWINHVPDLDCVCSHDSICGWVSESAQGRGLKFQDKTGNGVGGLDDHVYALNADRAQRKLQPVTALHVSPWPTGASTEVQLANNVAFLDDEQVDKNSRNPADDGGPDGGFNVIDQETCDVSSLIGGARIPTECLFERVAVGGTFDGLHYGHRKLLTLAVSSVSPVSGKLFVGVTVDEMLRHKSYAEHIPCLEERMRGVKDFIYRLAPGIKNRVQIAPIMDAYGPPGRKKEGAIFDALVLSHETLDNGCKLNQYRKETLGLEPLTLLCTRRTETYGMSSTVLRRLRANQATQNKDQKLGANVL